MALAFRGSVRLDQARVFQRLLLFIVDDQCALVTRLERAAALKEQPDRGAVFAELDLHHYGHGDTFPKRLRTR
jgi:hypothetical protein